MQGGQLVVPALLALRDRRRKEGREEEASQARAGKYAGGEGSGDSKRLAPFFQTVKVMAAILRAKVRRAIEGFLPLASKAS